jgi:hypothetical protein
VRPLEPQLAFETAPQAYEPPTGVGPWGDAEGRERGPWG